jgi:hypothetical protein
MSIESTNAISLQEDTAKRAQVAAILKQHGFEGENHVSFIADRVTRTDSGGLSGVSEALALLERAFPKQDTNTQKQSYRPVNLPPTRSYEIVSDEDAKLARAYFGKTSNGGNANELAKQRPAEYQRLKLIGRRLGLVG